MPYDAILKVYTGRVGVNTILIDCLFSLSVLFALPNSNSAREKLATKLI